MIANELLSKLKYLTLLGYEDGQYIWGGTQEAWNKSMVEEMFIISRYEAEKEAGCHEITTLPTIDYAKLSNLIKI